MAELTGRLHPNFGSRVRASPPPPKILPSNHNVESNLRCAIWRSKAERHFSNQRREKSKNHHHVDIMTRRIQISGRKTRKIIIAPKSSRRKRKRGGKIRIIIIMTSKSPSITRPTNWDLNSPCFTRGEAAQLAIHWHQERDDHKQ